MDSTVPQHKFTHSVKRKPSRSGAQLSQKTNQTERSGSVDLETMRKTVDSENLQVPCLCLSLSPNAAGSLLLVPSLSSVLLNNRTQTSTFDNLIGFIK